MSKRLLAIAFVVLVASACGAPKETEDPSSLTAEEERVQPGEARRRDDLAGGDAGPLASRGDCEGAVKHLMELGWRAEQLERKAATSAAARDGYFADATTRARLAELVSSCLAEQTTQREARCIAELTEPEAIDGCTGEGAR